MAHLLEGTDARSGYRSSDGVYYRRLDLLSFLFAPQYGERAALVDAPTGQSFTYAQLERRVRVVAAGLYKTLGVRQYDVVMLLSPNCVEFAVIFLAVVSLGAVLTTVNQVNTALEIQKQMKDAGRAPHIPLPPSLSLPCPVPPPLCLANIVTLCCEIHAPSVKSICD
jgi:non-ribosomal peptide synthetase component E (peptide arylation enzyme)